MMWITEVILLLITTYACCHSGASTGSGADLSDSDDNSHDLKLLSNTSIKPSRSHSELVGNEQNAINEENLNSHNLSYPANSTYEEEDEDPTSEFLEFIYPKSWTWALIFFHCVVFVVGLVGNCLVCVAVYRNHTMRTVTNYFIVNLAVADFLVILFCLPPSVVWDVTSTWWFGAAMCKIVLYLQKTSLTVFLETTMNKKKLLNFFRNKKCCVCHHVLSVFPIYCVSDSARSYICGRCKSIPTQSSWKGQLFCQEMSAFIVFPCSHAPCKKELQRTEVEDHERHCRHKITRCPTCLATVKQVELGIHLTSEHNTLIGTSGKLWVNKDTRGAMFVIQLENNGFFVYILDNKIAVLSMGRNKYTKFDVEVSPDTNNFTISFKKLPVIHYEESVHCFACITKKCRLRCHPLSLEYETNVDMTSFMTTIGGSWLKEALISEGLRRCYRISLIADETLSETEEEEEGEETEEEEDTKEAEEDEINNVPVVSAVRKVLNCPYCTMYMAAPIFMCVTGHRVCNVCMPKMVRCPLCQASFSESRNYPLEELADNVEVPCQHESQGCTLMGTSSRMLLHEVDCLFRTQEM